MLRNFLTSIFLVCCVVACKVSSYRPADVQKPGNSQSKAILDSADSQFDQLERHWLDGSMRQDPINATKTGDHRFDAEMNDFSAQARERKVAFLRGVLGDLEKLPSSALSRANQVDSALLMNDIRYGLWRTETFQDWVWDATLYTGYAGDALYNLMNREFAPLPDRLRSATARMEKLPGLLAQMRTNLDPKRVPRIYAETAAKQNPGLLSLIDELIVPHSDELQGADKRRLNAAIANLRKAVTAQQAWLDKELVPNAKGDFRLGATLYDAELAFALNSPLSRGEIRQRAELEFKNTRKEMYKLARSILTNKKQAPVLPVESDSVIEQNKIITAALELAAADRPARDHMLATAQATLTQATEFVRSKQWVTVPETPVEIIPMPEFQRGVAAAYCDAPGPLDKGMKTFYAVSPIPNDWSTQQVDSYLREYNNRAIQELTIHEAMPGHYLQLAHANQYPSAIRAILSSGSFVEGWAVYAEEIMVNEGYLNNDPLYRLIHLKWYLRAIANALLDQGIHVDGMTREQAMELMTVQAFQEEREAAGKWVRAQLSSTQLSTYFVGVQEHFDLRREAEQRWGSSFEKKRYHDTVLSFGSPPVRYVRALMFNEPIQSVH